MKTLKLFTHDDGSVSVADETGFVSALFVSNEAALSWSERFDMAEAEFSLQKLPLTEFLGHL